MTHHDSAERKMPTDPEVVAKETVRKLDSFKCAYVDSISSDEEAEELLAHDSKIVSEAIKHAYEQGRCAGVKETLIKTKLTPLSET